MKTCALLSIIALSALSSALNLDRALHIDGIEAYLHHGERRQASGTAGSTQEPAATPTITPPPASDDDAPASTSPPPASSTPPPASSDDDNPAPTPSSENNNPSSRPANNPSSSTPAPSSERITTPIIRTTPLVATSVQEFVTLFTTVSDGQTIIGTRTSSSTALITTGTAVATQLPGPQDGEGDNGNTLTVEKKRLIGGVVGGVGGAILLGGIAIVLWRLRSKKRVTEDDDDLMAGTGSALGDKPQNSVGGPTPFQSNLEQYHNPAGGRPNAAANF